jgi:hypothetical protein
MKLYRQISFQKFITFFLLAVLSFFITPKELIHEFHHHEDSTDVVCMDDCKDHIGNQHQHCDILQLTTPPLYHHVAAFSFHSVSFSFSFLLKNTAAYIADPIHTFFLRGPPSLV